MKTTKYTTCKPKAGFKDVLILRFRASKNKVFVLTVIATLVVFIK